MGTLARITVALCLVLLACSSDDGSMAPSSGGQGGAAGAGSGGMQASGGMGGMAGAGGAGGAAGNAGTGGSGGAPVGTTCPAARPVESSACTGAAAGCVYDEIECACEASAWRCVEPVDPNCPMTLPAHDSACTAPEATECDFTNDECECLSGRWACESAEGDGGISDAGPTDERCPMARPAEDSACTTNDAICMYEEIQCLCPAGTWNCNEPVDMGCPQAAPAQGSPCTGTADCDFLDLECECVSDAWDCKPND